MLKSATLVTILEFLYLLIVILNKLDPKNFDDFDRKYVKVAYWLVNICFLYVHIF